MKHTNIMRLLAYNMKTRYPTQNGEPREVILLVLEYLSGGELFDILYYTSKLSEIMARTYFKQLIAGVEALHNACIVHKDIKPQNLLLDKNFTLKICDPGLSKLIENDNNAILETYNVGSKGYKAPEILLNQSYTSSCDIFSAGVILFILLSGYPPFVSAKLSDRWYGNIATKKYKSFWKSHKGCGISPYAMDLITRMLHYSPEKRISLPQIKKHNWYLGKTLSNEELTKALKLRHRQMQLKRQNDPIKHKILYFSEKTGSISGMIREQKLNLNLPAPELPLGDSIGILDVFSEKCGYEIIDYFDKIAKHYKGTTKVDFENFQITIKMGIQMTDNNGSITGVVALLVRIYHYTKYDCNIVKFHRISGDLMQFRECLNFLQRMCRQVLTGVPKMVMESLQLSKSEIYFVDYCFEEDSSLNLAPKCIKIVVSFLIRKHINKIFPNDLTNVIIKYGYDSMRKTQIL